MAENLESRLLFSAAPIDFPEPPAHEAPIDSSSEDASEDFSFEPLDPIRLAALADTEAGESEFSFLDGSRLEFHFDSSGYEVEVEVGDKAGVHFMAGPRVSSTLVMSQDPVRVLGLEEALQYHSTVRVFSSLAM